MCDFSLPYRLSVPAVAVYEMVVGGKRIEQVNEFNYLGTLLCKHDEMDGEIRQKGEGFGCHMQRLWKREMSLRFEELHFPASIGICIRYFGME